MEILNVIAAGAAAWVFGAVWYMRLGQAWMDAAGLTEDDINQSDPLPYIISFIGAVVVAGMMRHVMISSGIVTLGGGLMVGLGLGLFIVLPWMINNVLFSNRSRSLIWMDGGYAVIGSTIIGVVLQAF
jgi:uncharacterized protein DUF1761